VRFKDDIALTGDADLVWKRASDLKWMPRYWRDIKSLEVLRVEGSETIVRFQFDVGEFDARIEQSGRTMVIYYTKGPFTGTQRISVHGNRLEVDWDIAFHGLSRLFSRSRQARLKIGTNEALERLVGTDGDID
jgi:hypothetical protein